MKRLLALAGSAIAGAAATLLMAAPAQAHHPEIAGEPYCQADGQYKIKWKVSNGNWDNPYMKIVEVRQRPADRAVSNITVDKWLDPKGEIIGYQTVPGSTKEAYLYIDAKWYKQKFGTDAKVHEHRDKTLTLPGTCVAKPVPSASFTDKCDGTVNVHLVNPTDTLKSFKVSAGSGNNAFEKLVEVAGNNGEDDVLVPAGKGKITVEVKVGKGEWKPLAEGTWKQPAGCAEPTATGYSDCTRFDIILNNPQGNQAVKAKIVYGTETKDDITVAPGATDTYKFELNGAPEATVTIGGKTTTIKYEKPAACDTLPKTGMDTTTMIASGGGLAALGAVVFVLARRRMVQLRRMAA